MPYSPPLKVEKEQGDAAPVEAGGFRQWASPGRTSPSPAMPQPLEVSPKDRSAPRFAGPEQELSSQGAFKHDFPHAEPPIPLSATSSSSSSNPIFAWPSLNSGGGPPGRDPFDSTMSFSDDPFAHRSSSSSSGDDFDMQTTSTIRGPRPGSIPNWNSASALPPLPMSVHEGWPSSNTTASSSLQERRPTQTTRSFSLNSDALGVLHHPQPRIPAGGAFDPWHSVSLELADSLQTAIQTLLYVSPPHLLDNTKEQYAGCSIQMPATSVSALLSSMRGLNYLSANLVPLCDGNTGGVRVIQEFNIAELVQTIADQLSAELAQVEVELVILQSDTGPKPTYLVGDREGMGYVLAHIIRQILAVANRGDTIEVALHVTPQSPSMTRRGSQPSPEDDSFPPLSSLSPNRTSSSPPGGTEGSMLCVFEIAHNVAQAPDLNLATPKAELNPFTRLAEQKEAATPRLNTPLCNRLLSQANAWLKTGTSSPSPFDFGFHRHSYELSVVLPRGHTSLEPFSTPAENERPGFNGLLQSKAPSAEDLLAFVETLRGRTVNLFATSSSIFGRQLSSSLTALGLDVVHVPTDTTANEQPPSARFVIIDEDISVLRRELSRLRVDSPALSLRHRSLKRPGLFRSSKSTTHLRPPIPATSVIHFTSMDKYQQVKDVMATLGVAALPEVLVVPKPVGPQRLVASLYTVVRQPLMDPAFTPIATSSRSPQISSGNRTPTGGPQEGFFDGIDTLQTEVAQLKVRSPLSELPPALPPLSRSSESGRLPASTPADVMTTPASEYFSRVSTGKSSSGASGVVIQSPDGRPFGMFFEPPPSGRSASFSQRNDNLSRKPNSRRTSTENEATGSAASPMESVHGSRRTSTISTNTDESIAADDKDTAVAPASMGRRKTLPAAPDSKPIVAQGRERSSTVTRNSDVDRRAKQLPNIAESHTSVRPSKALDVVVPPINVLIVEDNPINQNILSMFFKKKKIKHQTAKDGLEAVEKWRTGGFHLILMDIQLPVMDGIEATKEIRKLEQSNNIGVFPSTPVVDHQRPMEIPAPSPFRSSVIIVALTASSLQTDRVAALAAGCNDFLTKPVSLKWLEQKTVEWGCMQALIDFEGWRRWKGSDAMDPAETKRGFQTGPEAAAQKVASRLRIDRHKWRPASKSPVPAQKISKTEKPLPTLPIE